MSNTDNKVKMMKLGDRVRIVGGGTPSRKIERYYSGKIPWVTVKDLKGSFIEDSQEHISEEAIKDSATNLIPAGTVITCTRMALGKALINKVPVAINQDLKALICDKETHPEYLRYFISSKADWIISQGSGATVKGVKLDVLKELDFPDIPLPEQKRIAEILDLADDARRKRRENLKLYDDLIRSLFLKTFGDPVSNPMGWKVKKLKDMSTKILSGTTPLGGKKVYVEKGITFFRSQNVWKNRLVMDDIAYIDEKTHSGMSKSSLKNKDILMTKTGRINTENSSLGRAAMFLGEDDTANVNGHVYLIRLRPESMHEFVLYILTSHEYRDYIRSVCVGGIDKRQINKSHLEEFPIISPPIEQQAKFAEQAKEIYSQKAREEALYDQHDDLFNALLQRAFKGELG